MGFRSGAVTGTGPISPASTRISRAVEVEPLSPTAIGRTPGNSFTSPKTHLYALNHQVANIATTDAADGRHPRDRLAVSSIEDEGDRTRLPLPQPISKLSKPQRRVQTDGGVAIMLPLDAGASMTPEQQRLRLCRRRPLGVDCRLTSLAMSSLDYRVNPSVTATVRPPTVASNRTASVVLLRRYATIEASLGIWHCFSGRVLHSPPIDC